MNWEIIGRRVKSHRQPIVGRRCRYCGDRLSRQAKGDYHVRCRYHDPNRKAAVKRSKAKK